MQCKEGKFTKMLIKDSPTDFETVEKMATTGWILINIIKHHELENKWIYWFQSKKRIYEKTQVDQLVKRHKH